MDGPIQRRPAPELHPGWQVGALRRAFRATALNQMSGKGGGQRASRALLCDPKPLEKSTANCSRRDGCGNLLRVTLCSAELSDPRPERYDALCRAPQRANRCGTRGAGATLNQAWIAGRSGGISSAFNGKRGVTLRGYHKYGAMFFMARETYSSFSPTGAT
jgi:hypothetical protein